MIYPDSDDAYNPATRTIDDNGEYDRVEYAYHANGARRTLDDQNGSSHEYTYDDLGRLTSVTYPFAAGDRRPRV